MNFCRLIRLFLVWYIYVLVWENLVKVMNNVLLLKICILEIFGKSYVIFGFRLFLVK